MNNQSCCFFAVFLSVIASSFASANAGEIKNETSITIDFQSRQIQFYGIYAPGKSSSRAQGLDAEIAARRNGISYLSSYLDRSCERESAGARETSEDGKSAPSWQGVVKSQGSEIYSNGVLKILLIAPFKDVMKDVYKKKYQTLKTKDGTPLALRLPKLPASALKCGLLTLDVGGKTVTLNPLSGSSDSAAKVIQLSFDGSARLKPAGSGDLALLEGSNLFNGGDSSSSETVRPATPASAPGGGDSLSAPPNAGAPAVNQPTR